MKDQTEHIMTKINKPIAAALFAVTMTFAAPAVAQTDLREEAKVAYAQGRKDYDLGNFEKAIEHFKKAYEKYPDGAFLFNIAQSYRQLNDCRNALFFYKRFLSVKKDAKEDVKKEVEGHIKVLDECVKNQENIRNRLPDGTAPPDGIDVSGGGNAGGGGTTGGGGSSGGGGGSDTGGGGGGGGDTVGGGGDGRVADTGGGGGGDTGGGTDTGEDPEEPTEPGGKPTMIDVHAGIGGAKISAGETAFPIQVAFALTAGYPLALGDKLLLDVGAGFSFTPVPWSSGSMSGSATMMGAFVNAGGTFEVAPKISLRGALGFGITLLGGLQDGNPFTPAGSSASGTLAMPLVRAGLTGEYAITPNVAAAVTPICFSFSPPKDGMREDIDSLTRIEFMVGVGYRM